MEFSDAEIPRHLDPESRDPLIGDRFPIIRPKMPATASRQSQRSMSKSTSFIQQFGLNLFREAFIEAAFDCPGGRYSGVGKSRREHCHRHQPTPKYTGKPLPASTVPSDCP